MNEKGIFQVEDKMIGTVFPIHFLSVPRIVTEYLAKSELKCEYLFGIGTYGSHSFSALNNLIKIGNSTNKTVHSTNSICMGDNYLPGDQIEKELLKESNKNIDSQINIIVKNIYDHKNFIIKKDY